MPVGTIIAAGVTAAATAITQAVKRKKDKAEREKEVKRVEQREDTAISRGVQDSLRAGIDPRTNGSSPPSAESSSIAPLESPDYSQAVSNATEAYTTVTNLDQQQARDRMAMEMQEDTAISGEFVSLLEDYGNKELKYSEEMAKLADSMAFKITSDVNTDKTITTEVRESSERFQQNLTSKKFTKEQTEELRKLVKDYYQMGSSTNFEDSFGISAKKLKERDSKKSNQKGQEDKNKVWRDRGGRQKGTSEDTKSGFARSFVEDVENIINGIQGENKTTIGHKSTNTHGNDTTKDTSNSSTESGSLTDDEIKSLTSAYVEAKTSSVSERYGVKIERKDMDSVKSMMQTYLYNAAQRADYGTRRRYLMDNYPTFLKERKASRNQFFKNSRYYKIH